MTAAISAAITISIFIIGISILFRGLVIRNRLLDMKEAVIIWLRMEDETFTVKDGEARLLHLRFYGEKEQRIVYTALQLVDHSVDASTEEGDNSIKEAVLSAIKQYKEEQKQRHVLA